MLRLTYFIVWCVCACCGNVRPHVRVPYDELVIAVGAVPNTFGIPGQWQTEEREVEEERDRARRQERAECDREEIDKSREAGRERACVLWDVWTGKQTQRDHITQVWRSTATSWKSFQMLVQSEIESSVCVCACVCVYKDIHSSLHLFATVTF